MREERPEASLFIGLHKLAEQNGDGLVPELYALLTERRALEPDMTNVVAFPQGGEELKACAIRQESAQVLHFRR